MAALGLFTLGVLTGVIWRVLHKRETLGVSK